MVDTNPSACADWVTAEQVAGCAKCSEVTEEQLTDPINLIEVATHILFVLSGRQFPGTCTKTIRPTCANRHLYDCCCSGPSRVSLGEYPVTAVTSVKVDGVAVDAANYRVDDFRWLVRTDDECWPCCQDLASNSDSEDTFEVTFGYGMAPPPSGVLAVSRLACELYLACANDSACSLPRRVQQVTRRGVSMTMLDPQEFIKEGKTGIYEVDLFLQVVNPGGNYEQTAVLFPGQGAYTRETS